MLTRVARGAGLTDDMWRPAWVFQQVLPRLAWLARLDRFEQHTGAVCLPPTSCC
jgi:hypothetical protein